MWPFRKRPAPPLIPPTSAIHAQISKQDRQTGPVQLPPGWCVLRYRDYYLPCRLEPWRGIEHRHIKVYPLIFSDQHLAAFRSFEATARYCTRLEEDHRGRYS